MGTICLWIVTRIGVFGRVGQVPAPACYKGSVVYTLILRSAPRTDEKWHVAPDHGVNGGEYKGIEREELNRALKRLLGYQ